MNNEQLTVLFLCTGNSCRSIMAEALLQALGKSRFVAYSAGSRPAGYVHPQAVACLNRNRIPVQDPRSKSWDDFADTHIDLVVTVCGNAAAETCPVFPGPHVKAHWGVPDPALAEGSDAEIAAVFQGVFDALHTHIGAFVDKCGTGPLPTTEALQQIVNELGEPARPALDAG